MLTLTEKIENAINDNAEIAKGIYQFELFVLIVGIVLTFGGLGLGIWANGTGFTLGIIMGIFALIFGGVLLYVADVRKSKIFFKGVVDVNRKLHNITDAWDYVHGYTLIRRTIESLENLDTGFLNDSDGSRIVENTKGIITDIILYNKEPRDMIANIIKNDHHGAIRIFAKEYGLENYLLGVEK